MARNKTLIENRNRKILEKFSEMYEKKGVRYDWVIEKLSEEFFLEPATVSRIVFKKVREKK